jgi:hypothetical protein
MPRPPRLSFIIPIGGRVFMHCRAGASRSVPLADESGRELSGTSLTDGVEVQVVAWRPRGPTDTRYRVRTIAGERLEGWVFAQELRRRQIPAAEDAASAPSAIAPAHPVVPRAPVPQRQPARPSKADDAGRRFGERF